MASPAPAPAPAGTHLTGRTAVRRALAVATAALVAAGVVTVPVASPAAAATPSCASGAVTAQSLNPPVFYTDGGENPQLNSGYAGYRITSTSARSNLWVKLSGFTGGSLGLGASQPAALPVGALSAGGSTPAFFLLTAATLVTSTPQNHTVEVYAGKPGTSTATLLCASAGGFSAVQDTIAAQANKVADVDGDGVVATVTAGTPQLGGTVSVTVEGSTGTIGAGTAADPNGLYMTPTALSNWPAGAFRLVHTALNIKPDDVSPAATYTDLLRKAALGSDSRPYKATYTFAVTGTTTAPTRLHPIQQIASGTQIKHTDTGDFATVLPAIPQAQNPLTVQLAASPAVLPPTGGTARLTATVASSASSTSTLDDVQVVLPVGATYVPGSARLGGVAVPDPGVTGASLVFAGPFTTSSSAPAVLTLDMTLPSGAATHTASAVAHLADTVVDTTAVTTDDVPATAQVAVREPGAQTIDFPALPDTAVDQPAPALAATATSGLPVSYSSASAACSVQGSALVLDAPGACTVTASQGGDGAWSAATPVSRSFTVLGPREPQTIDFPVLDDVALSARTVTPAASASSGLPVTYVAGPADVCAWSGTAVALSGVGTCSVTAAQAGSTRYLAAPDATVTFSVAPGAQTIDFPALSDARLDAAAPALTATASSDLPVTYTAGDASVCEVVGSALELRAPGTCTVTARQGGGPAWLAAADEVRSFTVLRRMQSIAVPALPDTALGAPAPALPATASSGLPVTWTSLTPGSCAVVDGGLVLDAEGVCRLLGEQPGNAVFDPADDVVAELTVLPAPRRAQTIDFPALSDARLDAAAPALTATASSDLPVTYTTGTPGICAVSGGRLALLAVGTCRVTASQPGDRTWLPAEDVTRGLRVLAATAPPPPPPGATVGTAPSTVVLPDVPAGARVTVPADAATSIAGVARVTVSGSRVTVVPDRGFSGVITLPVTVVDGERRTVVPARVVVSPEPARTPVRRPATARSSTVAWASSPNATGYQVRVSGRLVCSTTRTSCTVPALLGPAARLTVTALGNDGTRSTVVVPGYRARSRPVLLTSVYFATDSAVLTRASRARLSAAAAELREQGFRSLVLSGHTDTVGRLRHNERLSRARADAVERYLRARLDRGSSFDVSYHAYRVPAESNRTEAGRAKNRRTDVSLG